jgi:hypothetical protein
LYLTSSATLFNLLPHRRRCVPLRAERADMNLGLDLS